MYRRCAANEASGARRLEMACPGRDSATPNRPRVFWSGPLLSTDQPDFPLVLLTFHRDDHRFFTYFNAANFHFAVLQLDLCNVTGSKCLVVQQGEAATWSASDSLQGQV